MPGVPLPASAATDEPHALLWFEQATNAGINIGSMTYGAHVTCFFMCSYYLWKTRPYPWFFQLYVLLLLIMATINLSANIHFAERAWIDYRNYPGGPGAFIEQHPGGKLNSALGDGAANVVTLLVDGLIIHRCYVVWGKNWRIVVLPILMYIAAMTMGIIRTAFAAQTVNALLSHKAVTFGIPYWALSVSLNGVVTTLIVGRILAARHAIRKVLGSEHAAMYTGVAAMVVESALPLLVVSFILVVLYGIGNTGEILFIPSYVSVQSIASELIILRVYRGRAWSKETSDSLVNASDMVFNHSRVTAGATSTTLSVGNAHKGPEKSNFEAASSSTARDEDDGNVLLRLESHHSIV